ncbi:uncharacterized protein LOC122057978 [Macadamia integrifolia]|uniref:uncharacterized protein LOC122057978 n=1 Tax=Macadamia integrifolia TaxID=60698 RepID=UPI001C52B9FA|nr:uncharacterized protein LOC122057978 [Macadamia integrifolia]
MVGNMGRIFLLNPFTKVSILLPNQSTLPPIDQGVLCTVNEQSSNYIRKAMLLPTDNSNLDGNNFASSLVVAIYGTHHLAFCGPGDEAWTPFENHHLGESLEDIIFYDGNLYAIKLQYDLILVELEGSYPKASSCNIAPPAEREEDITLPLPSNEMVKTVYLVECLGELLMVVPCALFHDRSISPKTATFSIFKLDLQGRCWIKVNNLGDQMLFIGTSTGCSVSTVDYP